MAITLTTNARNGACNGVVDLIDAGTGAGTIEIKTAPSTVAGTAEAATLTFTDPAFGNAATGVATASAITDDTSATGGTATDFTVFDSAGAAVFQGAVGVTGSDLNLSSTSIGVGDTVSITSFTVTMPAS